MKDELNSYGIINSDGVSQSFVNEGKVSFDNDRTDYISEWEKSAQGEMISVSETYDDQKVVREEESEGDNANIDLSLSSSTASATSASIGGGGGRRASGGGGCRRGSGCRRGGSLSQHAYDKPFAFNGKYDQPYF